METGGKKRKGQRTNFPPFSQIIWFTQLPPSYQERKKKKKKQRPKHILVYLCKDEAITLPASQTFSMRGTVKGLSYDHGPPRSHRSPLWHIRPLFIRLKSFGPPQLRVGHHGLLRLNSS